MIIGRANQVWALETTYIRMARGYVYLTAVVDVASLSATGHKVAIKQAFRACEVLKQAFACFEVLEIVNTDHGSQFTSENFTQPVLSQNCRLSIDSKGA